MFKHPCSLNRNIFTGRWFKTKRKGKIITIPRFFGVEIEAESLDGDFDNYSGERHLSSLLPFCEVGGDGSLANGVEVKTNPAMMRRGENHIKEVCKVLKEYGFGIKASCGLHVHVDARDFRTDLNKIAKLFKTVYAVEDLLFAMITPGRFTNHYCKPIRSGYGYEDFKEDMKEEDLISNWYKSKDFKSAVGRKNDHYNETRYRGLNLHALLFMGTVEFRYSHGRVNPEDIESWVQLLLTIVDYALNHYSSKEVAKLLKITKLKTKIAYLSTVMDLNADMKKYIISSIETNNPKKFELMKGNK
jgi:hypothetical protein